MRESILMKDSFNAKQTVTKWEVAQGVELSEPQWMIGKNMELYKYLSWKKYLFPQPNTGSVNIALYTNRG